MTPTNKVIKNDDEICWSLCWWHFALIGAFSDLRALAREALGSSRATAIGTSSGWWAQAWQTARGMSCRLWSDSRLSSRRGSSYRTNWHRHKEKKLRVNSHRFWWRASKVALSAVFGGTYICDVGVAGHFLDLVFQGGHRLLSFVSLLL